MNGDVKTTAPSEPARVMVIFGTSRPDGETRQSVDALRQGYEADIADLAEHNMTFYDYQHRNEKDGFLNVSRRMLSAEKIVFATPVYWYAMSAPMKIFFDRLSDLISIRKPEGRALSGKDIYLLANGTDDTLPEGFEVPFARTSAYFDMNYRGAYYLHTGRNETLRRKTWTKLDAFRQNIFNSRHPGEGRAPFINDAEEGPMGPSLRRDDGGKG